MEDSWQKVEGKHTNKLNCMTQPYNSIVTRNNYQALATSSTTLDPPETEDTTVATPAPSSARKARKRYIRHILRQIEQQESAFLDRSITRAENEKTELAKRDPNNKYRRAVEHGDTKQKQPLTWWQSSKNTTQNIATGLKRMIQQTQQQKCVRFAKIRQVRTFGLHEHPIMVTYDSGADGHYISEQDRAKAGLPVLQLYYAVPQNAYVSPTVTPAKPNLLQTYPSNTYPTKLLKPIPSTTSPLHS